MHIVPGRLDELFYTSYVKRQAFSTLLKDSYNVNLLGLQNPIIL